MRIEIAAMQTDQIGTDTDGYTSNFWLNQPKLTRLKLQPKRH